MKKNRNSKSKPKGKKPEVRVEPTRRSFLKNVPYVAAGLVAASGIGVFGVRAVRADLVEQDLKVVGSGRPVIVQIHDPSCPICIALQKETRAALEMMEGDELDYRVASIKSTIGSDFANKHGASHATLLFFDGFGNLTQRVQGATDRNALYNAFMAHVSATS